MEVCLSCSVNAVICRCVYIQHVCMSALEGRLETAGVFLHDLDLEACNIHSVFGDVYHLLFEPCSCPNFRSFLQPKYSSHAYTLPLTFFTGLCICSGGYSTVVLY